MVQYVCPVCKQRASVKISLNNLETIYCGKELCKYELENPPVEFSFGIDALAATGIQYACYKEIIKVVGLEEKEPVQSYGGAYKWDYTEIDPDTWENIKPLIHKMITQFYNEGRIRGGFVKGI
jgi:hypothetical protein